LSRSTPASSRSHRWPRRTLDVAAALAALIAFAPLMLVIAIMIRVDSPGPVFFRQLRLGRGGRHFPLYKFRKFYHAADLGGLGVTLAGDPRMTRVGRLLHRSKLDELPQFWNILVGDMSVVGPRPETLDFADCFEDGYSRVLDYLPGLFGPSQAMFRNESALYPRDQDPHEFYRTVLFPAKARIDLLYFARRSLMSDIGWIVRGILAVIGIPVPPRRRRSIATVEDLLNPRGEQTGRQDRELASPDGRHAAG
jgi:lipopolysaccharide/colanic/teichoic acid biosynthesis glycosyltransferase